MDSDRLKILCVAGALPKSDVSAGDQRFLAMLQILAEHHSVDLFVLNSDLRVPEYSRYTEDLRRIGVHILRQDHQGFELVAAQRIYDVAVFEFYYVAQGAAAILREQQPWVHIVVDSVDIHFAREEAGLALGISDRAKVEADKQKELEVYRHADTVVVVTPEDEAHLRTYGVDSPTALIPMIVKSRPRPEQKRSREMLFVGGFSHAPNLDGILWFANEVWPIIKAQDAEATLTIVGSNAPAEVQDLGKIPGIEVAGFVPDTQPYLDRAYLSVAPLRFGAGMKGKVTEAMAAGLAVVTTSFGAQGLESVPGTHLMVADDAEEFAAQVVALLSSEELTRQIGAAGQQQIESVCGFPMVARRLAAMLGTVERGRAPLTQSQSSRMALYRVKGHLKMSARLLKRYGRAVLRRTGLMR